VKSPDLRAKTAATIRRREDEIMLFEGSAIPAEGNEKIEEKLVLDEDLKTEEEKSEDEENEIMGDAFFEEELSEYGNKEAERSEDGFPDEESRERTEDEEFFEDLLTEEDVKEKEDMEEKQQEVFRVKYNGREYDMTLPELITNAQKGMNYDHILEERNNLRNSPAVMAVKRAVEERGISEDQIIREIDEKLSGRRLEENIRSGIPEEAAMEIEKLRERVREKDAEIEKQRIKEKKTRQFMELFEEYPDLRTLPPSVIRDIEKGKNPIDAYRAFELRELKASIRKEKVGEETKKKALPAMTDTGAVRDEDAFIFGLFGT